MPAPVVRVEDFDPVDPGDSVGIALATGIGGLNGRNGTARDLPAVGGRDQELVNAACWNFVLNGARPQLYAGLDDPSTMMNTMVEVSPYIDREVGGGVAPNAQRAQTVGRPIACHPDRITATALTGNNHAVGTELIRPNRQRQLREAFRAAAADGFPSHAVDSQDPVTRAPTALNIFDRTAAQQEFHYLLVKTIIQLYGFVTMSRERAAVSHHTYSRNWMSIVIRCSTWWGWDHWAFKATHVSGFHTVTTGYAQTVPHISARVGCDTFWDEHYPETRVHVNEMPRSVRTMMRALQ